MLAAIIYWFVHINIAVADLQIETAVRIGADPGFVLNARTLAAEVRQRYQVTRPALLTLGKTHLVQGSHLPTMKKSDVVYNMPSVLTSDSGGWIPFLAAQRG
jgi:hypothetical protein